MNLNINKDDSNINDFMYCWDIFNNRPNKLTVHLNYDTNKFLEKISDYDSINSFSEIIPDNQDYIVNTRTLYKVSDDIYFSSVSLNNGTEESTTSDIIFFYKNNKDIDNINDIIISFKECQLTSELNVTNDSPLTLVTVFNESINLEPIDFNTDYENIELYYNSETFKKINRLSNLIKKTHKGISILYSEKGKGKTSIIDYLRYRSNKDVIYIPNNMIDLTINNPSFIELLKIYNNSIIFIDDCEFTFDDIMGKQNITSNTIVQMVDGVQSNMLNLNFVLVYNTEDYSNIDDEILNSNNFLKSVYFEDLSEQESNDLQEHLGRKRKFKNKTKLIDIIKNKIIEEKSKKRIGF